MPTYVYKFVDSGETIEVQQGFHEESLTELAHPDSGEVLPVKKVFTPVGVTFKGSGFFKTDNRGKKSTSTTSSDSASTGSSSDGSSGSSTSGGSSTSDSSAGGASSSSGSSGSSSSGAGGSTPTASAPAAG